MPTTRRLGFGIFSMISLIVGVIPWHSSTITIAISSPNFSMLFKTVSGVPNTTGFARHLMPTLALKSEASPGYLLWFCSTSSFDGARQRTFLPVRACTVSARAAMMWLFPAPVAASIMHGWVVRRIHSMILSWASCW